MAQAGHGAHCPRRDLLRRLEPGPGVDADLVRLLLPDLVLAQAGSPVGQQALDPQAPPRDLEIGQTHALAVPGDLVDLGPERRRIDWPGGVPLQSPEELPHSLQLQGRTEPAGEKLPPGCQGGDLPIRYRPTVQVAVQGGFIAHGHVLQQGLPVPPRSEIHAALPQPSPQLGQQPSPVRSGQVHLVDKQEGGDAIALQQPPQGEGVPLHPVGAADHQDGAVQHLEGALHLSGEIHVSRRVQQGDLHPLQGEHRLLGEDGDAPLPLQRLGVQKGVLVVHPSQLLQPPAVVEQGLRQGGLSCVHMGQYTYGQFFHIRFLKCKILSAVLYHSFAVQGSALCRFDFCQSSRSGSERLPYPLHFVFYLFQALYLVIMQKFISKFCLKNVFHFFGDPI